MAPHAFYTAAGSILAGTALVATVMWDHTAWSALPQRAWRRLQRLGLVKMPAAADEEDEEEPDSEPGTGMPECRPIRTVRGLLAWTPLQGSPASMLAWTSLQGSPAVPEDIILLGSLRHQAFCAAPHGVTPCLRISRSHHAPDRPKLLVCHDMRGGYQADRWVQGSSDCDAYNLWRWERVDVFCYFSHHMVTVPPPAWVRAAHTNGAQVLGTFITEWAQGRKKCETLFASQASAQQVAELLAHIAHYHGFDGWLINIENRLSRKLLPNLLHCLSHLRARLRALRGEGAMLMWYDALTTRGTLDWQNHVTPLNQPFFDVCDAIYLNYGWKADTPRQIAAAAGGRAADVYLGVDVWGRGTYGGGQNNSHVALKAACAQGVSAALFAPGWLYEAFPTQGFQERSDIWWDKVAGAWPARPPIQAVSGGFYSSFCCGSGRAGTWVQGVRVSDRPWHNLALQQLQPEPRFCYASEGALRHVLGSTLGQGVPAHASEGVLGLGVPAYGLGHPGLAQSQPASQPHSPIVGAAAGTAAVTAAGLQADAVAGTQAGTGAGTAVGQAAGVAAGTAVSEAAVAAAGSQADAVADADTGAAVACWCAQVYDRASYSGGSCLMLSGPAAALHAQPVLCRLFDTHVLVPSGGLKVAFVSASLQFNSVQQEGQQAVQQQGHQHHPAGLHAAVALWVTTPGNTAPPHAADASTAAPPTNTSVMVLLPYSTPSPTALSPQLPAPGPTHPLGPPPTIARTHPYPPTSLVGTPSAPVQSTAALAAPTASSAATTTTTITAALSTPLSVPLIAVPPPIPNSLQDAWSPVSQPNNGVHSMATTPAATNASQQGELRSGDWTWACASPDPHTDRHLSPPATTSQGPRAGQGAATQEGPGGSPGQAIFLAALQRAGMTVCLCPAAPLSRGGGAPLAQLHPTTPPQPSPPASHSLPAPATALQPGLASVPDQATEAVEWRDSWLSVLPGQIPSGSLITCVGVVCWAEGATAHQGAQPGEKEEEVSWMLGHLGVHDPTQEDSTNPAGAWHDAAQPAPPQNLQQVAGLTLTNVRQHTQTLPAATADTSQAVTGKGSTGPLRGPLQPAIQPEQGGSVVPLGRPGAHPQPVLQEGSSSHDRVVCCDLTWQGAADLTGAPTQSSWHVWGQVLPPDMQQQPADQQGIMTEARPGSVAAGSSQLQSSPSTGGHPWSQAEDVDAAGSEPVLLPASGGWVWLGQAPCERFHSRVRVDKQQAPDNVVQWAVQPVSARSGLLGAGWLHHQCSMTV